MTVTEQRIASSKRTVTSADRHRAMAVLQRHLVDVTRDRHHAASCIDKRLGALLRHHQRQVVQRMAAISQWLEACEAATPRPDSPPPSLASDAGDQTGVPSTQDAGPLQVRVVARQDVAEHGLMFKLERPPQFTFQPGQYVRLQLGDLRRNYSIVSAPHEPFLEFFVDLVPGGRMSSRLSALHLGQAVVLAFGARGRFTMDGSFPQQVMVATGAGIAPFISILRAYLAAAEQRHQFHVFHGVSYRDAFGYDRELNRMATTHPQRLTYVPTVSRPAEPRNAAWTGAMGRVDTLIEPYFQQNRLSPETTILYACGNANMIRAVQQQFAPRGFTIHTERFWS